MILASEGIGFQNILDANGLAIAATGLSIVFAALLLVTLFLTMLPRALKWLAPYLPAEGRHPHHAAPGPAAPTGPDAETVVALAFALHQTRSES